MNHHKQKMKKVIIAIICIVSVSIIVSFALIIFGTIDTISTEKYAPYNYPNSKWVCEKPHIEYQIPENVQENPIAITEKDGEIIYFFFGTNNRHVDAIRYPNDKYGSITITDSNMLFSGTISYSKDSFTINIEKSSDILFAGEYDYLKFVRTENAD